MANDNRSVRVIPLGGLDGIGKNMTVIEYGNEMIVVDAGLMFPDDSHPGVDLILPDYSYITKRKDMLKGIIITHGHEDHTGALPYLLKDLGGGANVPIYATKMTLGLIKGKLEEHKIKKPKFREIKAGGHVSLGGFGCDFFAVNHSIPGAVGIFMRTPVGNILHTGDFKLDQTPIDGQLTDYAALSRFNRAGVSLMLSDSTNAMNSTFTRSESEVGRALREIIKGADQRVIVASFASHIHRIQQICDAAVAADRKVVVTGRSMVTNTKIARELGYLNIADENIIDAFDAKGIPSEKVVVLCTGSQGEPLSALARMANGDHRTVQIQQGDTVIISATPVPGNEKAVTRIINALTKIGAHVVDKRSAMVHVSGHAGAEELKLMLSFVQPTHFMPVHGEAAHLAAHADLARQMGIADKDIFVMENGDCLELNESGAKLGARVESGVVYVDGLSVGAVGQEVLRERQQLSSDGIATVVVMVGKKNRKPIGDIEIVMRGVVGADGAEFQKEAHSRLVKTLAKATSGQSVELPALKNAVQESLAGLIWERVRRRPMIVAVVMEA